MITPEVIPLAHRQQDRAVRHEWGLAGAMAITAGADVAVLVDVLSFTTTVSVAVDRGIAVLPYPWADDTAEAFARSHDALLAVGRSAALHGQVSLSPSTVRGAEPVPTRVVMPSPNGSTIAARLQPAPAVLIAACLRNAEAVAGWIAAHLAPASARIAVVSAGERWPDGSLRPAVEDLWGAGAVLAALAELGWSDLSREAAAADAAYRSIADDVFGALLACASGRELVAAGYAEDVAIAAEVAGGGAVPVFTDGAFVATGSGDASR